jgi:NAD(P)-dependent dehydrogenase (short-subunit alcohol dehydrogenase family)
VASGRLGGVRGQLAEGGLGGRAGRSAVGDQALAGVGDVQDLALELQRAGLREVGSISSMTDPASPLAQMPMASLAYPSSKAALNMITAMYAKELRDTPIKVNAANPGYTKTDLNHNSGFRSVTEGAEATVYLATLGADGPSGILWGHLWSADGPADAYGRLPW